jgi:hypothetical protein
MKDCRRDSGGDVFLIFHSHLDCPRQCLKDVALCDSVDGTVAARTQDVRMHFQFHPQTDHRGIGVKEKKLRVGFGFIDVVLKVVGKIRGQKLEENLLNSVACHGGNTCQ